MRISIKFNLIILLFFSASNFIQAYNLRQYTSKDGLSNSAILSMRQDKNGLMWIGSCDGLNIFDGLKFHNYIPLNGENILSGNIIERILDAEDDILWIQTNYGLDRLNKRTKDVYTFKEIKGKTWIVKSVKNDIFVIKDNNNIYRYVPKTNSFEAIYVENLIFEDIVDVAIDKKDTLWIFLQNGDLLSYDIKYKNESNIVIQKKQNNFKNEGKILWCFHEDDTFYLIDETFSLYKIDPLTKNKNYIYNLSSEILKNGDISSIIEYKGNYFIGFKSSGLIILQYTPEQKIKYSTFESEIKSGIFSLMKDKFQDIVWIGTDGQGIYMYYEDSYTIKASSYKDLPYNINNPIRALNLDKNNRLWIGTKGDGILCLENYNIATNTWSIASKFTSENCNLRDNSVYTIIPSKKNILWIGSEKGLNYYSFKEEKIKNIALTINGNPVQYIHSICELNDSTLWIATVGMGIIKAIIRGDENNPVLTKEKSFLFDNGKFSSNYFFTTYKENDSIIWAGNRGYGAYRINNFTEKIDSLTFNQAGKNQTLNDIFSITKNNDDYWFGTGFGLVRVSANGDKRTFNINGLPNSSIHSILDDQYNNLWMGTNQGLIKFNVSQNTFQTYKQLNEIKVTEFSDGANFKHEQTGVLFFGGINGFVTISANSLPKNIYTPPIYFSNLSIFGEEKNIFDFLVTDDEILRLNHKENFFSICFTAIDYKYGNDYTYFYKLDGTSDNWINNGISNIAVFNNIPHGKYTLLVKYRNNITGNESQIESLRIEILPPWYLTNFAYIIYFIIGVLFIYIIIMLSIKWYKMKKDNIVERINRQQREEIYESKLRFFTNITHELCTPLTLIYGPCNRIISYKNSDNYINKYATLIKFNAEKLNNLISELIEFRRLETGHKNVDIESLAVSELVSDTAYSFNELADSKKINYEIEIDENISWNSDSSCLSTIVINLISNAFKYTPEEGYINVSLFIDNNNMLNIIVTNTGKGIEQENINKIFDRYTILDNFESNKVTLARNGLGLAICHSMIKLLGGEIEVDSILNETTKFKVVLPQLKTKDNSFSSADVTKEHEKTYLFNKENFIIPNNIDLPDFVKEKKTIMIIDDDPSMLWFVTEIFIEKYNVIPIENPKDTSLYLKQYLPDLIISDNMMPYINGISLTALIKADKLRSHIPVILLSAKNTIEDQIEGIESGADLYITKPFDIVYLEKVVERLIKRGNELKQYFSSAISSFDINEGKLVHEEDKELLDKIYQFIDQNLSNPDLSIETISTSLGYSKRHFYRKLKDITSKTPNNLIREYKLNIVKKLLIDTNLSIDEIMDRTGFTNRGNFFKIFFQLFGTTPKKYREKVKNEIKQSDTNFKL